MTPRAGPDACCLRNLSGLAKDKLAHRHVGSMPSQGAFSRKMKWWSRLDHQGQPIFELLLTHARGFGLFLIHSKGFGPWRSLIDGFPTFPHGFPMVSLWFPYGFPMVSLWSPYGLPMVSLWFPYGLAMVSLWSPYVFLFVFVCFLQK